MCTKKATPQTADDLPPSRRAHVDAIAGDPLVILRVVCDAGSNILEPTHQYTMAIAKARFRSTVAEKVSLACWELFSNALSYGSISRPVVLELIDSNTFVELRVSNDAIAVRCQLLDQRVKQLKLDAKGTYLEEMRRSVSGGVPRATLGLARVVHEGKMDLDAVVVNSSRVTVTARCAR
ncbi:MAG: hypothetical protein QM784_09200 [Polyangiaceae bacterium]